MTLNNADQDRERPPVAEPEPDSEPVPSDDGDEEADGRPEVPAGVLRGIEDIAEGRTASKSDLESLLKY